MLLLFAIRDRRGHMVRAGQDAAHDRTGLLYAITRALFELGLSVWRAKIGTYLDQVVDVFYVTDGQERKIEDEQQLEAIRGRLLKMIASLEDV